MTAAGPVHDSALNALGYAARVLTKPRFWLVPLVLSAISTAPLFFLPLPTGLAGMNTFPGYTSTPPDPAVFEAYFRDFLPVLAATLVLSLVIGPFLAATGYRLAGQYVDGQPPNPFGPGIVNLAWRFVLLALAWVAVYLVAAVLLIAFFVVALSTLGPALTFLIVFVVVLAGGLILGVRLALASVILLSGAGPIAALQMSWEMTRGHFGVVFRWLFVTGVLLAIIGGVLGGAIGLVFGAIGLPLAGQLVAGVITAPVLVIQAIIQILLVRLLSGPIEPPPPPPVPEWMSGSARGG